MKLLTARHPRTAAPQWPHPSTTRTDREPEPDFLPVVKLFTPDAGCTWLLTEIDPDDPDIAFGLCDLGIGYPELGSVSLSELASVRGRLGLAVERTCISRQQRRCPPTPTRRGRMARSKHKGGVP